jgi:hypothetical protein
MKFSGGFIESAIRGPNFGEERCNQKLVKFNANHRGFSCGLNLGQSRHLRARRGRWDRRIQRRFPQPDGGRKPNSHGRQFISPGSRARSILLRSSDGWVGRQFYYCCEFSDGNRPNDHAVFVFRWRSGNFGCPLRFRLEHTPGAQRSKRER